jgi:hypothetical protein
VNNAAKETDIAAAVNEDAEAPEPLGEEDSRYEVVHRTRQPKRAAAVEEDVIYIGGDSSDEDDGDGDGTAAEEDDGNLVVWTSLEQEGTTGGPNVPRPSHSDQSDERETKKVKRDEEEGKGKTKEEREQMRELRERKRAFWAAKAKVSGDPSLTQEDV